MEKWEVTFCLAGNVESYLEDGWEPFAVTVEEDTSVVARNYKHLIWLRRKLA